MEDLKDLTVRPASLQGYLAHKKTPPPRTLPVGLCLGPYSGPRGWAFSRERGAPIGAVALVSRRRDLSGAGGELTVFSLALFHTPSLPSITHTILPTPTPTLSLSGTTYTAIRYIIERGSVSVEECVPTFSHSESPV